MYIKCIYIILLLNMCITRQASFIILCNARFCLLIPIQKRLRLALIIVVGRTRLFTPYANTVL